MKSSDGFRGVEVGEKRLMDGSERTEVLITGEIGIRLTSQAAFPVCQTRERLACSAKGIKGEVERLAIGSRNQHVAKLHRGVSPLGEIIQRIKVAE